MENTAKVQGFLRSIFDAHEIVSYLKDYFAVATIKDLVVGSKTQRADRVFYSSKDFWMSAMQGELLAGQIVELKDFRLLEWIPASPGLFYTRHAESQRRGALDNYERGYRRDGRMVSNRLMPDNNRRIIELHPNEKRGMVQGGYGSLRVAPKFINKELQHIICASSTGVSHEGLAITLKQNHYSRVMDELLSGNVPVASVKGRLMILPNELSPVKLKFDRDIPKFYLDIEELDIVGIVPARDANISVAVTFAKRKDYFRSSTFSYSFCSFSPINRNEELKEAVMWLQDYAVRYSEDDTPLILGDFDEEYEHFENVDFPIRDIANGRLPIDKLSYLKEVFHFEINEMYMGDKNIITNSTVGAVGSHATASNNTFQQLNNSGSDNLNYELLNAQLEQLRAELLKTATTPDQYKAIGSVAAAEMAAKEKKGSEVVKYLKGAGQWVFDTATKIGVSVVSDIIKGEI